MRAKQCPYCASPVTIDIHERGKTLALVETCNVCGFALAIPLGSSTYDERRKAYDAAARIWRVMGRVFRAGRDSNPHTRPAGYF